jgi:hypothetical protein
VWEGHTDGGVPVVALITRITPDPGADLTEAELHEFVDDLQEMSPPRSAAVQSWPARMLID